MIVASKWIKMKKKPLFPATHRAHKEAKIFKLNWPCSPQGNFPGCYHWSVERPQWTAQRRAERLATPEPAHPHPVADLGVSQHPERIPLCTRSDKYASSAHSPADLWSPATGKEHGNVNGNISIVNGNISIVNDNISMRFDFPLPLCYMMLCNRRKTCDFVWLNL